MRYHNIIFENIFELFLNHFNKIIDILNTLRKFE